MASSILSQLVGPGGPPPGGPPASIPDPEPHLAPGAPSGGGGGDPLAALLGGQSGADPDAAADLSGIGDTDAATEAGEPGPQASEAPNAHMGTEISTLKQMIGLADGYRKIKSVEPDEAAKMAGVSKTLHDLLAANQKGQDSLSGANPAMRKALAT